LEVSKICAGFIKNLEACVRDAFPINKWIVAWSV